MEHFRLINSEVRLLTEELAIHFRDMDASPTERDWDPKRVSHLKRKFDEGLFIPPHWATVELRGHEMRMNGRHSSTMLAGLNGSFPTDLQVHVDKFAVDDEKELATLFQQFDDRKSSRTIVDVASAYQGLYEPLRAVPKKAAKIAIDGVVWWRHRLEGLPVPDGNETYTLFDDATLYPFILWFGCDLIREKKTDELMSVPVIAAIYETVLVHGAPAKEFWSSVAVRGDLSNPRAPATVLDEWLLKVKSTPAVLHGLKPMEIYQGCMYAWQARVDDNAKGIGKISTDTKKGITRAA